MKLASITVVYQDEQFIPAHFKMLEPLDERIVLIGDRPFKDYFEAGRTVEKKDRTEELVSNLKGVTIVRHSFDSFCGNLFNLGMEKAKELGCDAIIKLDPDMLLTEDHWKALTYGIYLEDDWDTLLLDYKTNTIAYKKDFDHGHQADIFPVGQDPLVVRTNQTFIQDGVRIRATGRQKVIRWPGFMVHHFTGFRPNVDEAELRRVEKLGGFRGWQPAPAEIKQKFS